MYKIKTTLLVLCALAREYAEFTDMSPVDKKKYQRDM